MKHEREIKILIEVYRKSVRSMYKQKKLSEEQYNILNNLAENMTYDRDVQELIDQLRRIMAQVNGEAILIRECLLAKQFKTANLIAQGVEW